MTDSLLPYPDPEKLAEQIRITREANPTLRARELASEVGISEGVLLSARCGDDVTRLRPADKSMLERFAALGEVMILTRNESVVHEKVGEYGEILGGARVALVLNGNVDLRMFMAHWVHVFAIAEVTDKGTKRALHVYDAEGTAVHKIILREASNVEAFDAIVADYRHENQMAFFQPVKDETAVEAAEAPDDTIDVAALREEWQEMKDVHQFFGMLKRHNVARHQALRLGGEAFAWQVSPSSVRLMLEQAAARALPIMVFVSNQGCVQIHTGPVTTLKAMGPWYNVLDPEFNMHLRDDHIAEVWVVRKPNIYGHVTAIEVYDANRNLIVQFYGVRVETEDENPDWRALAESMPGLETVNAAE